MKKLLISNIIGPLCVIMDVYSIAVVIFTSIIYIYLDQSGIVFISDLPKELGSLASLSLSNYLFVLKTILPIRFIFVLLFYDFEKGILLNVFIFDVSLQIFMIIFTLINKIESLMYI